LSAALAKGLQATGVNVIDIGLVATPILYYATNVLGATKLSPYQLKRSKS
jgi:phosphomannomutase/phosphoglucomutase